MNKYFLHFQLIICMIDSLSYLKTFIYFRLPTSYLNNNLCIFQFQLVWVNYHPTSIRRSRNKVSRRLVGGRKTNIFLMEICTRYLTIPLVPFNEFQEAIRDQLKVVNLPSKTWTRDVTPIHADLCNSTL